MELKCIKAPTKWSLQLLDHLDIFARGRVILMGDSVRILIAPSFKP
jgi:salicylate hydroxylase